MDRYERIMNDILSKTATYALRWEVTGLNAFNGILPDVDGVRRVARADYQLGERSYQLCFIESRKKRVGDFGAVSSIINVEIYVLNHQNQVALILTEELVDRDDLLRLASLIDDHNDQTREFFEAFDRSGAA